MFETFRAKHRADRQFRDAIVALERMTDRELRDIGVRRGDIAARVRGAL